MIVISFEELQATLRSVLCRYGFEDTDAELCSKIFAENNLFGVASHGTNRFPSFIDLVNLGLIIPQAKPALINSFGAWEQWDAKQGPGPLNAWKATERAMTLASENGIGCVTLKNTNHWMRAGTYGWKAAENGFVLIGWTNAIPMMPPWGSKEPVLGNNPMVLAVPRHNSPVVLDMALSQYSYGQLANYRRANQELPYPGGYDSEGNLSKNPAAIYETKRALPIGYWKGSGLSILLDLIATILSGGKAGFQIGQGKHDTSMSQVFISIDPRKSYTSEMIDEIADSIINSVKSSEPDETNNEIFFPGERALSKKQEHLKSGIPIDEKIWQRILNL